MNNTVNEVLEFIEENDVKFVRLAFCDIFGTLKNISVMASELPRAFKYGISFDASAVKGFMKIEDSDLFLVPDPATLSVLPWRPQQGRVVRFYCNIFYADGQPFAGDGRNILRQAVTRVASLGYSCRIGTECEFYLFQLDENGKCTKIPHDTAGYFDVAPYDKGENVRREICLTLEEMGIQPETSHHEQGPGQNEIDFKYGDALLAADNLVTFKNVVSTIAARNGLWASFAPKPLPDHSGNGLHVNMSLASKGINIFKQDKEQHSAAAKSFIAGILNRTAEITAFLNPLAESYQRLGVFEAPKYLTWSPKNRSQLIRIPAASDLHARMELRSPDPCCNPYLAFTLLLDAGMEGIKKEMELCPPNNFDLYKAPPEVLKDIPQLPGSLGEALELAEKSEFIKYSLPKQTMKKYLDAKKNEWELACSKKLTEL